MEEVKVTIGMDAGPAERELTGLQGNVRRTEQVVKDVTGTVEVSGQDIEKIISAINASTQSGSDQVTKKLDEVVRELTKVREASRQTSDANKEHTSSINDMTSAMSALPGPVGQAASAFRNLTSVVKKFISSPLLWFLAAVATAYQYLTWSLNRTVEGQEKLDLATAKYHQRLENVKDAASAAGRTIFSALDSAASAADKLLGKLGGIGRILGSLGGSALGPLGSVAGALAGDWGWNRNVAEAVALQQRENQLWHDREKALDREADLRATIADNQAKLYDTTISLAEREKAYDAAMTATNEMYESRLRIAREEASILAGSADGKTKGKVNLSDSDRQAIEQANAAKRRVKEIETEYANAKRTLNRMNTRLDNQDASGAKAAADAAEEAMEQRDALFQQRLAQEEAQAMQHRAAVKAQAEARIAAIEDAGEREREEQKHQHQQNLQQIQQQADAYKKANYEAAKKAYEAANPGKKYSQTEEGSRGWQAVALTDDQSAELKAKMAIIEAEFSRWFASIVKTEEETNRKAITTYLKQYGDYSQKLQAIYDDANAEICKLEGQLTDDITEEKRAGIEAQIEMVKRGAEEEVEALNVRYGKAKAFMADLFGDASQKTVNEIKAIIEKYEALEKFLKGDNSVERTELVSLGFTEAEIDRALDKLNAGEITVKEFTDALKGLKGELSDRSPWQKFTKNIGDAIEMFKSSDGDNSKIGAGISAIGKACSEYMPEVEKFTTAIFSMFGMDDSGAKSAISALQGLSKTADGIGQIVSGQWQDGMADTMSGISQLVVGIADTIRSFTGGIDLETAFNQEEVKAIREAVDKIVEKFESDTMTEAIADYNQAMELYTDSLEKSQKALQDAMSQSRGGISGSYNHRSFNYYMEQIGSQEDLDKVNALFPDKNITKWSQLWELTPDELALIQEKLSGSVWAVIKKAIAMVREKAGYSSDPDTAADALEDYMELKGKEAEINASFTLKMTGTSVDDVKSDFKSMLLDMTSDAETFSENFEKMMRNAVVNALMSNTYNGELEKWYEKFSEYYGNDGELDADEKKELREDYERITKEALAARDAVLGIAGAVSEAMENTRDVVRSSLLEMTGDVSDFSKNVRKMMFEALAEQYVFQTPAFSKWLEEWQAQYDEVLNDQSLTQEQRDARLNDLRKELEEGYAMWAETLKACADAVGYSTDDMAQVFEDMVDEITSAFEDTNKSVEEWAQDFKKKILKNFIETFFFDDATKARIRDAVASIMEIMYNPDLTDEQKRDYSQVYIDDIENVVENSKQAYATISDLWGLTSESAATSFDNMRDSMLDALMDVEHGAEDFARKMKELLTRDLIEKFVMTQELDVLDGSTVFNNYDEWQKSWLERYVAAVEAGDEALIAELQAEAQTLQNALAESAQRYTDGLKEITTDTTFKDMSDSFVSSLMDMDKSAEDWGQDIGQTLLKKLIEQFLVADRIKPLLADLQEAVNDAMSAEGATAASVIGDDAVQAAIDAIKEKYPELQKVIQELMEALNIKTSGTDNPFSDISSSLVDALMDADTTAEQWGKQIGETLARQMVTYIVNEQYGDRIKEAAKALSDAVAVGNPEGIAKAQEAMKALYAEVNKSTQAITDTQKELEKLNNTTFTDMSDSFLNALMDMKAGTEDFAKDIKTTLMRELANMLVMPRYKKQLEELQQAWTSYLDPANGFTKEQQMAFLKQMGEYVKALGEEAQQEFDAIAEGFGYSLSEIAATNPFSDLRSQFLSELMDMEASTEDFAKSIGEKLTEAFIDKFVLGEAFDDQLKVWQDRYSEIMSADISEEERAKQLKDLQNAIAEAREGYAIEARRIQDWMGTSEYTDQDATVNMADKATYDQFELYLGIAMAQQIAMEQGNAVREQILATLRVMSGLNSGSEDLSEIRQLLHTGNGYLWELKESNAKILAEFGLHLTEIKAQLCKF